MFEIKTTASSIDAIRLTRGHELTYPYVTRSNVNNGIARFVDPENRASGYDRAGSITVGLDTQTAFLQPHDFVTGQNIQIISREHMTGEVALFMLPILRSQMRAKFNWGGNGATLGRMKRLRIMLPVDAKGRPDWKYMEACACNLISGTIKRELEYLELLEV